jgi:hypothetical protein
MATADQMEREAKKKAAEQAALAKLWNPTSNTQAASNQYLARNQAASAAGQRVSPDTIAAGMRVTSPGFVPTSQKSFDQMSKEEQIRELNKVDWNSDFFKPKPSGGGQSSSSSSTSASTPADTSTPSGGGGTGGGEGGGRTETSNVDAIAKMYAEALTELQRQYGVSQENINAAIGRMESDPYNMANAYAQMQLADPRVAVNPVAEYMAAAGMAPGQAAAQQQMAQAEADAYMRAMQNVQNIMSTSQQQANLSRMSDIGLIRTGAQQDLESNLNMLRLGLEKERIGAVTGQQQQNLQNDLTMRNAIATQISNIFSGQDVAPESILKLIEAALAKINTNRWTTFPAYTTGV